LEVNKEEEDAHLLPPNRRGSSYIALEPWKMCGLPLQRGEFASATRFTFQAWFENLYEKEIRLKLFSTEVYYKNSFILLVNIMLCSKLHCHFFCNLVSLSYKILAHVLYLTGASTSVVKPNSDPQPSNLNHHPSTPNLKSNASNPKFLTPNPKPHTSNPKPQNPNPKP
jgi:hypothetical protein